MANSANPEINKKIATSALGTLVIATVFFYLGDRYAETLVTYPGQIFDHLSDAFLSMWQTIKDAPFALDMTSNSLLFGGACFLIIWMIWLRYVAFIGNYRSGEESGSARWGTVKEGKKFKDLQTEDTAGQTYTLTGTLMDKSTKKAFVDADGNPVTATAEFTAEAESGTATVTFTFNASSIKTGTKLIAFETLSTNGIEIADHKDINDIDQTVTVKAPVIGTTAVDAADGDKTVTGEENVAVRDTVHYNNVTPGKTYKVIGTLYEKVLDKNGKVTKKVFKDKDGTPVTAEANFTAEDSYGNVDVTFYFDGSSLKEGTSLVAFESLSYNDNEIASHADVNDSGQTVIITKPNSKSGLGR